MSKRINFKRPVVIMILLFLAGFLLLAWHESKAEVLFEVAPNTLWIGGDHTDGFSFAISDTFSDNRYSAGVILLSEQDCTGCNPKHSGGNMGVQIQRLVRYRAFEMGIGAAYWNNQTAAWNSNLTFSLSIGFQWEHFSIKERHWSTGGSSIVNDGQDGIYIGWRF